MDEVKVTLYNEKIGGTLYVRCEKNERLDPENIIP
jgi:hypothetical protein